MKSDASGAKEIIVRCLKQPTVANVKLDQGEVNLDIEKEMEVGTNLVIDVKNDEIIITAK